MRVSPALAMLWLLPLGGCALFHSNIKGGFACTAPHGTCAPSTTIDDDAIRTIGTGSSADDSGTTTPPDAAADSTEASNAALRSGAGKSWTFVGPAQPALKVLYSAWRDGAGHLHPRTAAYVPVNAPRLAAADVMALDASQLDNPRDTSLLSIAEMAPDMGMLASPEKKAAPGTEIKPTGTTHPGEAAALGNRPTDPLSAIKDQVKQILGAKPFVPPAPVKQPEAKPALSGGSFPPSGN